jgi:tRNA A-37 threonylcarbamoyl transferase component Bud32
MTDEPIATPSDDTVIPRASKPVLSNVVDGRYVLEQRLGDGGMGVVYRARDQLMESHQDRDPYIAVKVINDSMRSDTRLRTLLQRECSRAQKLSHPNIIRVFYFGCDKKTDTDYMTMELLQGLPLERLIKEQPSGLDWVRVSRIVEQLCNGLEYAHGQGIVHSDIKPSNLFLTDSGQLKILDFGIAAPLRRPEAASNETLMNPRTLGAVSERYSSLEMHMGWDADPSDDVFSAACVIYELLTGRHPFKGMPTPQAAAVGAVPDAIPALNKRQNRALRDALAFRKADRIAGIVALKNELLQAQRSGSAANRKPVWIALGVVAAVVVGVVGVLSVRYLPAPSADRPGDKAASVTDKVAPATELATPGTDNAAPATDNAGSAGGNAAPETNGETPPAHDQSHIASGAAGSVISENPPKAAAIPAPTQTQAGSQGGAAEAASSKRESVPQKTSTSKKAPVVIPPAATVAPSVAPAVTDAKPDAAPVSKSGPAANKKRSDQRCGSIEERIQLGETPSGEERAYYKQNCQ